MQKKIWIMNHYAGQMYFEKGMRHYWIAKYLRKKGYEPIVICSNSKHNSDSELYFDDDSLLHVHKAEEIDVPFVFVKSRPYTGNGKARIMNMADFYRNVIKASKRLAAEFGKPDIIYASSVHPLTLAAGLKIAKRFGIKCICEVRDLWPESLVAYGMLKKDTAIAKALYAFEKKIYKKAEKVVMTWPGGYDYIVDRGWEKEIPESKVVCISNGVDLDEYTVNLTAHPYNNPILTDCGEIRIVYAGSIRKVNDIGILISAAEILKDRGVENYKLFLFGDGDEREGLEQRVKDMGLTCVLFMGKVPKSEIPSVLSQADIAILHNKSTSLDKYGQSQNKFFEYLASGSPILMTYTVGYSIVQEKQCGIEVKEQTPEAIADAIQYVCGLPKETLSLFKKNAAECAKDYDFKLLSEKVISVIEAK